MPEATPGTELGQLGVLNDARKKWESRSSKDYVKMAQFGFSLGSRTSPSTLMERISNGSKRRVCYFFDSDIGGFHYGPGHPMKPTRIRMCHSLVMNYGLYQHMEIFRAKPATKREMTQFHSDEYIDFLSRITPNNMNQFVREQHKYNVGDDCPVFDGLFEYCSISAGGSMEGAARLSRDKCDIAINWAGGLHHAKKGEASGFCYVNDIVLGILELLRYHSRVLYIDIDCHHGDGVEEAFYTTDRVMTVSFHKYGEYFPGTGDLRDTGIGKGKGYSCNIPLRDGITDENYRQIFQPIITEVMRSYNPSAVVLQCGTDSLSGDKLGCLNLSMRGHAECVRFVKSFGSPLLLLGGGGYTMRNVSRAWAYETGLAVGVELYSNIPMNEYYEYFGPDYTLDVRSSNMEDFNNPEYIDRVKSIVLQNLRELGGPPSVQMMPVPKLSHDDEDPREEEDLADPDERRPQVLRDKYVQPTGELDDSEDELDTPNAKPNRRNRQSHKDKMIIEDLEPPTATANGSKSAKEPNGSGPASMDISESSTTTTVVTGEESGGKATRLPSEDNETSKDSTTGQEEPESAQPTEPVSPSAAGPGLSMNAFGRPKMTAAVVDGGEDMDVDNPDEQQGGVHSLEL